VTKSEYENASKSSENSMGTGPATAPFFNDEATDEEVDVVDNPNPNPEDPDGTVKLGLSTVGSSEMRSFVEPYGQKMKLKVAPVHCAGLEGGSATYKLFIAPQETGQPVAVSVFGGFWPSKTGIVTLAGSVLWYASVLVSIAKLYPAIGSISMSTAFGSIYMGLKR
jgi:hypothetical protein